MYFFPRSLTSPIAGVPNFHETLNPESSQDALTAELNFHFGDPPVQSSSAWESSFSFDQSASGSRRSRTPVPPRSPSPGDTFHSFRSRPATPTRTSGIQSSASTQRTVHTVASSKAKMKAAPISFEEKQPYIERIYSYINKHNSNISDATSISSARFNLENEINSHDSVEQLLKNLRALRLHQNAKHLEVPYCHLSR